MRNILSKISGANSPQHIYCFQRT